MNWKRGRNYFFSLGTIHKKRNHFFRFLTPPPSSTHVGIFLILHIYLSANLTLYLAQSRISPFIVYHETTPITNRVMEPWLSIPLQKLPTYFKDGPLLLKRIRFNDNNNINHKIIASTLGDFGIHFIGIKALKVHFFKKLVNLTNYTLEFWIEYHSYSL